MKKYFAKLDGDLVGIDHYVGFKAKDDFHAQEIADKLAEQHYSQFENPYDEEENGNEGDPKFYADVEEWDEEKHGEYIGDGAFTNYFNQDF